MRSRKNNGKKSNGMFLAALIILAIIVATVFILVTKDQILTNLKETDFFGRVFGSTPEMIEKHESKPKEDKITLQDDVVIDISGSEDKKVIKEELKTVEKEEKVPIKETENKEVSKPIEEKKEEIKKETTEKKEVATPMMNLELCFVQIDNNGNVMRKMVKRNVPKTDSPLTTAINFLLQGPNSADKNESKLTSLIPEGSKLLSARVKDGIAYLNFNDMFEFTNYGVEGSIHQLEQVVYTATAFSTVNKVQFLIEGKEQKYLGSEGQWIGTPLSRSDF